MNIYKVFGELSQWTGNMYYACINDGTCLDT